MADLREYCARAQFVIYKVRSNNYIKEFGPTRVDIACARGKIRPPKGFSRSTTTTKADCP
ncbi:hypothetical protein B0T25DRAFT_550132 [Lasiosphaeria hispida]|uniref:Uncharacterized protein n=1 Tax=Lasiosphaeria hispida TaxID=260671 RepID=A0AAJ0HG67_9PEZI|nr:hypothetical protein B0T25DRAFT_550132 [Lasiosphaeria hispida]